MKKRGLVLFLILPIPFPIFATIDPYDLITSLLDPTLHPRVLNTLDLSNWNDENPEPLFSPEGDFNKDGQPDMAIAGIYDLPKNKDRYFLIVGTYSSSPSKFIKLFYR